MSKMCQLRKGWEGWRGKGRVGGSEVWRGGEGKQGSRVRKTNDICRINYAREVEYRTQR